MKFLIVEFYLQTEIGKGLSFRDVITIIVFLTSDYLAFVSRKVLGHINSVPRKLSTGSAD